MNDLPLLTDRERENNRTSFNSIQKIIRMIWYEKSYFAADTE